MKKKIIGIAVLVLAVMVGVIGYFAYQENVKQKNIKTQIGKIESVQKEFKKSSDRKRKFELLKTTLKEQKKYENDKEHYKKISDEYTKVISKMQRTFINEYDNTYKDSVIEDIENNTDSSIITTKKETLSELAKTINTEKEYTFSNVKDAEKYENKINDLINTYSDRLNKIEEDKKAEEEAKQKAEEEAKQKAEEEAKQKAEEAKSKTHYETEYFSVDVPESWADKWTVTKEDKAVDTLGGKTLYWWIYHFSYDPGEEDYGGGADIYVLDMSDTSVPITYYGSMMPEEGGNVIGETSFGCYEVFKYEVAAGFFWDNGQGATITLK